MVITLHFFIMKEYRKSHNLTGMRSVCFILPNRQWFILQYFSYFWNSFLKLIWRVSNKSFNLQLSALWELHLAVRHKCRFGCHNHSYVWIIRIHFQLHLPKTHFLPINYNHKLFNILDFNHLIFYYFIIVYFNLITLEVGG